MPHTHWDREWYQPEARARQRLVALLDDVLARLEHDPQLAFHLDGQVALIDDYLAVRPEARPRVSRLAEAGRLSLGPWYVLADELLAGDEPLVRNLLVGRRRAAALGGWLAVGYSPDAFGHPAALPTILRGFGIGCAVLWRGYGGQPGQEGDRFRWVGPDGSEVLVHHLPPDGYEYGANLPADPALAARRWADLRAMLEPRAAAGSGDAGVARPGSGDAGVARSGSGDAGVARPGSGAAGFARPGSGDAGFARPGSGDACVAPPGSGDAGVARPGSGDAGFARPGSGDACVAPSIVIMNGADHHALQPDLARAMGSLRAAAPGFEFEIGTLDRCFDAAGSANPRAGGPTPRSPLPVVHGELRWSYGYAWTLQGVHATRAGLKRRIAEGAALLTRWAEPQAALAMAMGGPDRRPLLEAAWRPHLLNLFHDVLAGSVADPVAEDAAVRARHVAEQARGILDDALLDRLGQDPTLARRHRDRWRPSLVVINPSPTPRGSVVEATVTLFRDDVAVGRPAPRRARDPDAAPPGFRLATADGDAVPMQVLEAWPAQERLDSSRDYPDQDEVWAVRVAARVDGVPPFGCVRLSVEPAPGNPEGQARGPTPHSPLPAVSLISDRDEGDTYTFEPVPGDRSLAAVWGEPRAVWTGPLMSAVAHPFRIGDRARGTLFVRRDAGSALIRYVVDGTNLRRHHRLRIVFPVGAAVATADMPFGPVTRPRVAVDARDFPREWPATTAPMHRYVCAGGRTILARGLHEYELLPDGSLAVTLLRGVGDLSRGSLRARPGHAGWPTPTPGAQELGPFRAELAVGRGAAGEGDGAAAWTAVERLAEEFHAPLAGRMLRWGIEVPETVAGPELIGRGLAFKALKPRDDGPGVVLRCVNLTGRRTEGAWRWPGPIRRAFRARLDETVLSEIRLGGDRTEARFVAEAREVVTTVVEP